MFVTAAGLLGMTTIDVNTPYWEIALWMIVVGAGSVLIMGVGIGVVGYGLHELYNSYQANFEAYLKRGQISDGVESVITNGGRFGLAARGVVFTIVGIFLTVAALRCDPSEAAGLGGALQELLR